MKKIFLFLIVLLTAIKTSFGQASYCVPESLRIDETKITFFGNGVVQTTIDSPDKLPASTGIGVGYLRTYPPDRFTWLYKLELDVAINIGSNADTIVAAFGKDSLNPSNRGDFGTSILLPLASRQSVAFNSRFYLKCPWLNFITGFRVSYNGNNRFWTLGDKSMKATFNAVRIGVFHDFIPDPMKDRYSILFGVNYALNGISGDVSQKNSSDFRNSLLGSKSKVFHGVELGIDVRLKNLRFSMAFPYLVGGRNDVPGLTAGRLITTATFIGGFDLK